MVNHQRSQMQPEQRDQQLTSRKLAAPVMYAVPRLPIAARWHIRQSGMAQAVKCRTGLFLTLRAGSAVHCHGTASDGQLTPIGFVSPGDLK